MPMSSSPSWFERAPGGFQRVGGKRTFRGTFLLQSRTKYCTVE